MNDLNHNPNFDTIVSASPVKETRHHPISTCYCINCDKSLRDKRKYLSNTGYLCRECCYVDVHILVTELNMRAPVYRIRFDRINTPPKYITFTRKFPNIKAVFDDPKQ